MPQLPAGWQLPPIPRAAGVSNRVVRLALLGRFADELLGGLPDVLMPTIRRQLGLSLAEVSLLRLTLDYVAAFVEPINGLLIDLWPRRRLLAFGAMGLGLAIVVMGLAPTLLVLLVGFALYGLGSGPLAHTADVVLVETHPEAPDRIFARGTFVDTVGALLAPLVAAGAIAAGVSWRWLLVTMGLTGVVYAVLLWRTRFPAPLAAPDAAEPAGGLRAVRANLRAVWWSRPARLWLLFLLVHNIQELPDIFTTIWLREEVGLSQTAVALYRAGELAVSLLSLVVLDRWRQRSGARRLLLFAGIGTLLFYPAWLLTPGVLPRLLLAVPLTFCVSFFWPIAKGQSLSTVPGRAGTLTAVESLYGFLPLSVLFGLLATAIGLTRSMLLVHVGATLGLLLLTGLLPGDGPSTAEASEAGLSEWGPS